ncbi:hypothetical protein Tco_0811448, partial [Tanacetum coccineum]
NEDDITPSSSTPSDVFAGGSAIRPDVITGPSDAPSDKGKSPMLEEEPPVSERSFRQREEDRLGEEAARRLYEVEQAELAREREEQKQKRQKDVLESAKYYTDADWNEIMGQVHANQGLSADCSKDGVDLEQPDSKKSKSTKPQKISVPATSRPSYAGVTSDVHQSPFVDTPLATPPHSLKASSHPDVTPDTSKQPTVAPTPSFGFSATPTVTRTSGPRTRS